jgi:hypothetical protein
MQEQDPAIREMDSCEKATKLLQDRDDGLSVQEKGRLAVIFTTNMTAVRIYLSLESAELRVEWARSLIEQGR